MSVVRLKGEENTVMRDYVLPDFSSIKKGFCKVRRHLKRVSSWVPITERLIQWTCPHCPPASRGDGLQWKVQDRRADPEAGQRALCCPRDALPPVRHRHPGDGHPRGHRALHPVPARRSAVSPAAHLVLLCYSVWVWGASDGVSALRDAGPLLPEHRPDRRKHFVSRLQRETGGRAAIPGPRSPPRVRPAACKVRSASFTPLWWGVTT